jgi:hypothetical protein
MQMTQGLDMAIQSNKVQLQNSKADIQKAKIEIQKTVRDSIAKVLPDMQNKQIKGGQTNYISRTQTSA